MLNIIIVKCLLVISFTATQAVLNFEDENFNGEEADRIDWLKHPCHRTCTNNEKRKICHYLFVVEQFTSMSKACYDCPFNITDCSRPHCIPVDGVKKAIFVVNRQIPGPSIQVCKNDVIVIDVKNRMLSESTTIHWHGILQNGTSYMDGVPFVTQCPILPGNKLQYNFTAHKTGTYFWHSHIGSQRADGAFGTLIVREPKAIDLHRDLYDYDDSIVIINDWYHIIGDSMFLESIYGAKLDYSSTIIINGKGRYEAFKKDNQTFYTPVDSFNVTQDYRYRFRLINSGAANCPIQMTIDNHTLNIISLDSSDIDPVEVDVITTWPGERIDFVVNANQTIGNYWIRYRGLGNCKTANSSTSAYQVAILRYKGAEIADPKSDIGYDIFTSIDLPRVLNPVNENEEGIRIVHVSLLNSSLETDINKTPDQQIFLSFDLYAHDNYDYHRRGLYGYNEVPKDETFRTILINNISFHLQSFPLLSQRDMIKPNMFCNRTNNLPQKCLEYRHCVCTHVINIQLHNLVELVFIDQGLLGVINHPLHLHGHFFHVVAMSKLNGIVTEQRIKQLDRDGKIKRKLDRSPSKDTIKTPGGGYTIVRFYANNPGYWLFHCHFEQHVNMGMSLIFKVGEHKDMDEIPKNFPKCGTD